MTETFRRAFSERDLEGLTQFDWRDTPDAVFSELQRCYKLLDKAVSMAEFYKSHNEYNQEPARDFLEECRK